MLGPLAVIACYAGVYLLARDIAGPVQALIATLSLIGIHYYNYSAVKFAHDQMQLPFWAFTALFFYRALARGSALRLAAGRRACWRWPSGRNMPPSRWRISLAVFLIADPLARRTLAHARSRG